MHAFGRKRYHHIRRRGIETLQQQLKRLAQSIAIFGCCGHGDMGAADHGMALQAGVHQYGRHGVAANIYGKDLSAHTLSFVSAISFAMVHGAPVILQIRSCNRRREVFICYSVFQFKTLHVHGDESDSLSR